MWAPRLAAQRRRRADIPSPVHPPRLTWTSERSIRIEPEIATGPAPETVRAAADALTRGPDWIDDIIPSARSLLVLIDPLRVEPDQAESFLRAVTASPRPTAHPIDPPREIIIPVCYDPALAPDLEPVAARLALTPGELAALHAGADYTVECLGFSPGFAYLLGLPDPLHLPRRDTPRPRVPAGSVAIAGERSGVYPQSTPGGWHLIGRTPMTLFDPARDRPAVLSVADSVRFRPITRREFDQLAQHAPEHA